MAELRRFDPISVMKISFVIYLFLGFIAGIFTTLAGLIMMSFVGSMGSQMSAGMFFGPLAIIVLPLAYGTVGALLTGLGALVYNFLAAHLGGIQVQILFPVQQQQR